MKTKYIFLTVISIFFVFENIIAQGTWTHYSKKEVPPAYLIQTFLEDSKGNIWLGTSKGLFMFDGKNWETYGERDGLPHERIEVLMEDRNSNIWIGTIEGLTKYCNGEFSRPVKGDGSPREIITCLLEDSHGNIWVGSNYLFCFDGNSWTRYTNKSCGLYGVGVILIEEDKQQNIWVATVDGKPKPGEVAQLKMGMKSKFGNGAISKFNGIKWEHFYSNDQFPKSKACVFGSFLEDSKGNIWLGAINQDLGAGVNITYGSLMRYDGEKWICYSHKNGLVDDFVKYVCEDSNGNIYAITRYGVNVYDGFLWTVHTENEKSMNNIQTIIMQDSKGNIWIGRMIVPQKGLLIFNGSDWTKYTKDNGLSSNLVTALHEDRNGNIWVGHLYAKNGPLTKYDGEGWTIYSEKDGLVGKSVVRIEEDSKGNLWIFMNKGISKYTPNHDVKDD